VGSDFSDSTLLIALYTISIHTPRVGSDNHIFNFIGTV